MEYEKAVKRPFTDLNKFLIGVLLLIVPFLNLITGLFVRGYSLECAKSSMKKKFGLPEWRLDNFVKGLIGVVIMIIYLLPVIILGLIFIGGLILSIFSINEPEELVNLLVGIDLTVLISVLLLFLFVLYIIPMAMMSYVEKWRFRDAFSCRKVFKKSFNLEYLKVVLFLLFYGILIGIGSFVVSLIPFVGIFVAMAISGFILGVTSNTLFGEVYRKVK